MRFALPLIVVLTLVGWFLWPAGTQASKGGAGPVAPQALDTDPTPEVPDGEELAEPLTPREPSREAEGAALVEDSTSPADLGPSGTLLVRVVDEEGLDLPGAWRVQAAVPVDLDAAFEGRPVPSDALPATWEARDPRSGVAELRGVAVGEVRVRAYLRSVGWVEGPMVQVRAGETQECSVVYSDTKLDERVIVQLTIQGHRRFLRPRPGTFYLEEAGQRVGDFERVPRSAAMWQVEGVQRRSYTVVLEDERFLPLRKEGVRPGSLVAVFAEGSSALKLSVVDADGEAQLDYELRVQYPGANISPNEFSLRSSEDPLPEESTFRALVAGEPMAFLVDAGEAGTGSLELPDLKPGETREAKVELTPGVIRVIVERAPHGRPVAGAEVALLQGPLEREVMLRGQAAQALERSHASGLPRRIAVAKTDEFGRAQLAGLGVEQLVGFATDGVSEAMAAVEGHELRLTFPGYGKVRAQASGLPNDRLCEGRALWLLPVEWATEQRFEFNAGSFGPGIELVASQEAPGMFEALQVPAGEYQVEWRSEAVRLRTSESSWITQPSHGEVLAKCTVREGLWTRLDLDLGGLLPGELRVSVDQDNSPAEGYAVHAVRAVEGQPWALGQQFVGHTDERGMALLGPLAPGEWSLYVSTPSGDVPALAPVRVPVSGAVEASLSLAFLPGQLVIQDAVTAEPMASTEIYYQCSPSSLHTATTDAEGRLDLELAAGSYRFATEPWFGEGSSDPDAAKTLSWTASGPSQALIRLAPSDF